MDGEDIKYLVYLFFVVIYIISKALKKKKVPKKQIQTPEPVEEKEPAVTFEDLLREFGADIPKKETPPVPRPVEPVEPVVVPDDNYAREVYQKSIESAALKREQQIKQSPAMRDQGLTFERDEHYKIFHKENRMAEKLKNPQTLVDAIILSEIINRKYD